MIATTAQGIHDVTPLPGAAGTLMCCPPVSMT